MLANRGFVLGAIVALGRAGEAVAFVQATTMRSLTLFSLTLLLTSLGCDAEDASLADSHDETPSKPDASDTKADGANLCIDAGLPADCDICAEFNWYQDNVCDDFCKNPDPDCGTQPPAAQQAFECIGVASQRFFDLSIIDVGDQAAEVIVNDGGAPKTYVADYRERSGEHGEAVHAFAFGFDEKNTGTIDALYTVSISQVSHAFWRGPADYDGLAEEVICYDPATISADDRRDFDCLSVDDGTLFDLTVIDVGDQEGAVVVNDGGAPASYTAEYRRSTTASGQSSHRFLFGFDEVNAGNLDDLYRIDLEEVAASFATGSETFEGASALICYKP